MSFGCERSCSSPRRVSNFNSNAPQGGIYPHIKFERDPLNIFRVRLSTSSGSTGGPGDAKTIISPSTSFGDINRSNISRSGPAAPREIQIHVIHDLGLFISRTLLSDIK